MITKIKYFILIFFISLSTLYAEEKDVLVLHSYNQGLEWTDDISRGILDTFEKSDLKINIYFEYLDAKRNTDIEFLEKSYKYFLLKYKKRDFDAIIVSDNKALMFMNKYKSKLFPNEPIIFCGVNDYKSSFHSNIKNITGVRESVSHKKTISLGAKLFPKRKKLLIILDHTLTGQKLANEVKKVEKKFSKDFDFTYVFDLDEIELNTYIQKNKDNLIAYILTYNLDKEGKFYSYKESIKYWKKKLGNDIPIIGSWSFFARKGIVGGAITSGYKQGEIVANLTLDILNGKLTQELPILKSSKSIKYIANHDEFVKFNLNRNDFPKDTKILNTPMSFWQKNKLMIILVGVTLSIVLLFSFIFIYFKVRKNRQLEKTNAILDEKVKKAIKNTKERESLFKFIADSTEDTIFLLDNAYKLTYTNKKNVFYEDTDNLLGKNIFEFFPQNFISLLKNYLNEPTPKLIKQINSKKINFDGKIYAFSFLPRITDNKNIIGYKGILKDITQNEIKIANLTKDAIFDKLTGLYNRVYFDKAYKLEFEKAQTQNKSLGVILIDIDFFKKTNDTYGHLFGDIVLQQFSKKLKDIICSDGICFRIGGEEFLVMIKNVNKSDLINLAEHIRKEIQILDISSEKHSINITISLGCSIINTQNDNFEKLFKRADDALYKAKDNGRNRVCFK